MAKTALLVLALRACALVPPGARRAAAPRRRAAAVLRARSLDGFLDSTPAAKAFYDGAAPARRRTPSSRRRRRAGRFREFRVDVRRPVDATRRPRRAASAIRGRPPPRSVVGVGPRPHRGCRRQHRGAASIATPNVYGMAAGRPIPPESRSHARKTKLHRVICLRNTRRNQNLRGGEVSALKEL